MDALKEPCRGGHAPTTAPIKHAQTERPTLGVRIVNMKGIKTVQEIVIKLLDQVYGTQVYVVDT